MGQMVHSHIYTTSISFCPSYLNISSRLAQDTNPKRRMEGKNEKHGLLGGRSSESLWYQWYIPVHFYNVSEVIIDHLVVHYKTQISACSGTNRTNLILLFSWRGLHLFSTWGRCHSYSNAANKSYPSEGEKEKNNYKKKITVNFETRFFLLHYQYDHIKVECNEWEHWWHQLSIVYCLPKRWLDSRMRWSTFYRDGGQDFDFLQFLLGEEHAHTAVSSLHNPRGHSQEQNGEIKSIPSTL